MIQYKIRDKQYSHNTQMWGDCEATLFIQCYQQVANSDAKLKVAFCLYASVQPTLYPQGALTSVSHFIIF